MWKAFSRSVCEVVERRVGFTAFRSDVSSSKTDPAKCVKIPCNGIIPQLKTYCPLKHLKVARYKQTSQDHTGEKHQHRNKNHARWREPPITACLGAMGWSSALVLGWYLCQPLGRRIFGDTYFREIHKRSPQYVISYGQVQAQSPIQPLGIHPLNYRSSIDEESTSAHSFSSSFTSSVELDETFSNQRGPFTPEEALNEVSREFEAASRALSGDVENKLGMICMSKGQHSQAMKHFRRASHHEHAIAAYNLGQCYELGLGTTQNLKKAAKWYKIGSDRGHPTAMYNLAVFLANGWGGLCEDQSRARELLTMASSLGLEEAKDALSKIDRNTYVPSSELTSKELNINRDSTDEFLELIGATVRKEPERYNATDFRLNQTNLSHLDWLDLSSSSLSSFNSEDVYKNIEDPHFYSDLCLESSQNLFSKKSGIITLKLRNGDGDSVYVVERVGSDSGVGESLDEAANYRVVNKQRKRVAS